MALNQYISVKVCGNPDSNSGFVPILLFNSPSFAVEDQFYVGFDNCSYFYTIKTTPTQTIYKLVKNNVRSYGSVRPGSLIIAFSVPQKYTLGGGYTPYDVLSKLKDEFLKRCMICKDSVRETYEFSSGLIDQHVLDDVASEFSLLPSLSSNRCMNPNGSIGYIVKTDAEIEKLFHDINYPEFESYSEIIVAESVNQTSYIPINNIQIPRIKSYEIYVDGGYKGSCADLNETITVSSNNSPEYYDNKSIQFTIQNLKDGDVIPGIELQEANEKIMVSTQGWANPKRRKINLKIVPKDYENYILKNSHLISITWPYGEIKLDHDFSFTLIGEQIAEIKRHSIQLFLKPNDRCKLVNYDIYGDELRVTVSDSRPPVGLGASGAGQYNSPIKSSPVYDVSIRLKGKNKFEKSDEIVIKLRKIFKERSNHIVSTCRTKFKPISKDVFEGHIYVPKENHPASLYLCFRIGDKNYVTKNPLASYIEKGVIEEGDFISSKVKPFYKSKGFLIKLLVPVFALLLGFVLGYVSRNLFGGTKQALVFQPVKPSPPERDNPTMTQEQASDFLKDADDNLRRKDLEFSKIDTLYKTYIENKDVIRSVDKDIFDNKVCDRIEDYYKLITYIKNGDVEQLRAVINTYSQNNYHIWPKHADLIKQILKDDSTIEQFRNNYSKISGFALIHDAITAVEETSDNNITTYKCDKCGKTFDTEVEKINHSSSHFVRSYACD